MTYMDPDNIILATDSYKVTHWQMYPEGTKRVYSYFESRKGSEYPETVFFGLQYLIKKHLVGRVVTEEGIHDAEELAKFHFGDEKLFNRKGWEHILHEHKGELPLRIKAVAEGTVVPKNNVLMTVENTCDECCWLTNLVESLLTHVWYPTTVATISKTTLDIIKRYVEETGGNADMVKFQLQDFGYRGASSHESAMIGGLGHLVSGVGSDTIPAMLLGMRYYNALLDGLAYSVPATEHSIMTSLGRHGEAQLVGELLKKFPTGILSVVSDSYDIFAFVDRLGNPGFKEAILERDGKFVVRPDSGDPVEQMVTLCRKLWAIFGGTVNEKGFRELDPHVGLLWGDGINTRGIEEILEACMAAGFCASNFVFGMGGGLLQKVSRDTLDVAFKCSAQLRDGEWVDIQKDPLDHTKKSKKGRLQLEHNKHGWFTTTYHGQNGNPDNGANLLKTVFLDGKLKMDYLFEEVRENALK